MFDTTKPADDRSLAVSLPISAHAVLARARANEEESGIASSLTALIAAIESSLARADLEILRSARDRFATLAAKPFDLWAVRGPDWTHFESQLQTVLASIENGDYPPQELTEVRWTVRWIRAWLDRLATFADSVEPTSIVLTIRIKGDQRDILALTPKLTGLIENLIDEEVRATATRHGWIHGPTRCCGRDGYTPPSDVRALTSGYDGSIHVDRLRFSGSDTHHEPHEDWEYGTNW